MDNATSGSEVSNKYNSKSGCNESPTSELSVQSISDWEDVPYLTQESKVELHQDATTSSTPTQHPNLDALFDSGLLKSPPETSQCLSHSFQLEYPEGLESDIFDDTDTKEKFSSALVLLPKNRPQSPDPNRINEFDRFRRANLTKTFNTFINNQLKPQNEFKKSTFKDFASVAGTSGNWRKYRSPNRDKRDKGNKGPSDPSPLDDVKSLTNCIIQNSLNKIDVKEDGPSELIEYLSPLQGAIDVVDAGITGLSSEPEPRHQESLQQALQHSNLVNNKKDNEGINMSVNGATDLDIDEGIDLLNDNLEDLVPLRADNVNVMEISDGVAEEARHEPAEKEENPVPPQDVLDINDETDVRVEEINTHMSKNMEY